MGKKAAKQKLLVVVGAGASMEFGMPSVDGVGKILAAAAQDRFALHSDKSTNLYRHIAKTVADHWDANVASYLNKSPNFEDILYTIYALAAAFPAGKFTSALGALVEVKSLPEIDWFGVKRSAVDQSTLRELGNFLVDTLLEEFRDRCKGVQSDKPTELSKMQSLFSHLGKEFETAVVTLNYDDIVYRVLPSLETGFEMTTGRFVDERIFSRTTWPCILHLHGSVHFDMQFHAMDLHEIHWQENLDGVFQQNSTGRSPFSTAEGPEFPTSAIIAGYGKTTQILRRPFRTYYSELDRLVADCDAALFLGYGFGDLHLNFAFERFRDRRRRPVVIIDFADDTAMTAGGIRWDESHRTVTAAMGVLGTTQHSMTWLGHVAPDTVAELKKECEFEVSSDPDTPLSLWYNGMLSACDHFDKVLCQLQLPKARSP